ncbi:MAG: SapB/AmfS family lanthipeptide [Pseudonocardiales bacterium]|nr:SapB/AmfS family lanthipeptide [Pseudonocardiales bacterium]MBV9728351.1 SapB/AmfS family lanthipeptide [Pseudonocardiales bacterium]
MALLDLQAMEPSGGYDDCHDHYDRCDRRCGSEISLLLCGD